MTLRGAVVDCKPGAEGPSGLAKCKNDSVSVIFSCIINATEGGCGEIFTNEPGNPNILGAQFLLIGGTLR